jgi:hypothetical protein
MFHVIFSLMAQAQSFVLSGDLHVAEKNTVIKKYFAGLIQIKHNFLHVVFSTISCALILDIQANNITSYDHKNVALAF